MTRFSALRSGSSSLRPDAQLETLRVPPESPQFPRKLDFCASKCLCLQCEAATSRSAANRRAVPNAPAIPLPGPSGSFFVPGSSILVATEFGPHVATGRPRRAGCGRTEPCGTLLLRRATGGLAWFGFTTLCAWCQRNEPDRPLLSPRF